MKKLFELTRNFSKKNITILLIVVNALAIGIIVTLSVFLKLDLDYMTFTERKASLGNITELSANLISREIESGWNFVDTVVDIVDSAANDFMDFEEFYSSAEKYIYQSGYTLSIYDSDGHYYNSNGESGRSKHVKYFKANTDDKLVYISTDINDIARIIYRIRLSNSLSIKTEHGYIEVKYCSVSIPIENILKKINTNFNFSKAAFFFEQDSGKIISEQLDSLDSGSNIFDKLSNITLHDNYDTSEIIADIMSGKSSSDQFTLNNKTYIFCVTPLADTECFLGVLVSSNELDSNSTGIAGIMFKYISAILFTLGIVLLLFCATFLASRNNQLLLEKEIEANKFLSIAEDEAKKASASKSSFLFNMSHDIRTPLNAIKGFTEMAVKHIDDKEKVSDCLEKIQKSENQLLSLVNDILDLSRIESGKTIINEDAADINTLCKNCSEIIEGQLLGRDIEYIHDINILEHSQIFADELQFRRVMVNLIGNSVKFTNDGGKITFSCKETEFDGEKVTFEFKVSDTGIGMSEEFLKKIWNPFEQAESKGRTTYKGTGLGTTISKQLVEMMGGTINVESELNVGTTFTVTIPFKVNTQVEEAETELVDEETISLENINVLLVEDNELNAEIAQEILEEEKMKITWAENGRIACEKFAASSINEFEVILMDIQMPEMNGYEATDTIRKMDRPDAKTVPIIALSANAFAEDVKKSLDAGMNGHVAKPIDIAALKSSIKQLIIKN